MTRTDHRKQERMLSRSTHRPGSPLRSWGHLLRVPFSLCGLVACLSAQGQTHDKMPRNKFTNFQKGALCGRVVDVTTGKPIAFATVAIEDNKGKVLAWTRTDAQGRYAVATDSIKMLRLQPTHHQGLFDSLMKGVGTVVETPFKVTGVAVKTVTGMISFKTAETAALAAITGNPSAIASQLVDKALKALSDAIGLAPKRTSETAVRVAFGERLDTPKDRRIQLAPGEVMLSVSAPDYKDEKGKAGTYWLDPPAEYDREPTGVLARMETVSLAPVSTPRKSEVKTEALLLSNGRLEPSLIPAGATVHVVVKLDTPDDLASGVRIFAREAKKNSIAELMPISSGSSIFAGELILDKHTPAGPTTIVVLGLRAIPVGIKLSGRKADPLLEFARRVEDMTPGKHYEFDPRFMATENRLEMALNVLDPRQGTAVSGPGELAAAGVTLPSLPPFTPLPPLPLAGNQPPPAASAPAKAIAMPAAPGTGAGETKNADGPKSAPGSEEKKDAPSPTPPIPPNAPEHK